MRGCSVFTRPPSISGESVTSSTRSTGRPIASSAAAVFPLATSRQPSADEPAREAVEAGLVVGRRSARAQFPHHLRQQPVLDRLDPLVQRLGRVAGETGTRSCASTGPVSTPSSTRWTVAPDSATPAASCVLDRVRAGERRQQRRVDVDDRAGEAVEEGRREQVHVAGEDDEARRPAPRASRPSRRRALRGPGSRRARRPRSRRTARSSAGAPLRLLATATTGRPASSSACRFVPRPLTRTPITRSARSRARRARLRARPRTSRCRG